MGWGTSNGLVIDLAQMKRVTVDPQSRTARVGAGALSGEVMRAAGAYGLAPVLGQCPGVGAAGVTLGGGIGWLSGVYGAACDNLLSCRMLTATGGTLSVDAERDAELLWGMRGAGANFGVVSSFECRLHPVRLATSGDIYYSLRDARTIVTFFRGFLAGAPDSFQASLNLTRGERGVFISLCHAGEESEADRLLRALRRVANPAKESIRRLPFSDLAGRAPVAARDAGFRCIATVYRNELSNEVIDLTLDRLSAAPPEAVLGITHYMHGELCRVSPDSTAFPLRTSGGVHIRFGLDWNDPVAAQSLMNWAEDARGLLRPSSGERIYANYQSHAGKETAEAVFGSNLPRLVALKNRYDPANRLRRNSNIQPRLG